MSLLQSLVSLEIAHSLPILVKGSILGVMRARNVVAAVSRPTLSDSGFHLVHVPCLKAARGNQTKKGGDVCGLHTERGISKQTVDSQLSHYYGYYQQFQLFQKGSRLDMIKNNFQ